MWFELWSKKAPTHNGTNLYVVPKINFLIQNRSTIIYFCKADNFNSDYPLLKKISRCRDQTCHTTTSTLRSDAVWSPACSQRSEPTPSMVHHCVGHLSHLGSHVQSKRCQIFLLHRNPLRITGPRCSSSFCAVQPLRNLCGQVL